MIEKYNIEYEKVVVRLSDLERFIGYSGGDIPDLFKDIINEILADIENHVNPTGGYSINEASFTSNKNEIVADKLIFTPSQLITARLKKSEKIAAFVCTIGKGITEWANEFLKKGDTLHSYICDVAGSVLVEKTMDIIHADLKLKMADQDLRITNRYSPGYCDWSVAEQQKLFKLLPENFCGITLTETSLMNPIKSISGFIGIGKGVKFSKHDCELCNMENCVYRNK
ncbi:MAG: hypothetical protein JEY94_15665 [Melioribacteraceae bacterium]|nr:hypothetical protein [Melioribacteraceae bacterium]